MTKPAQGLAWDFACLRSPLLPRETWDAWNTAGSGAPEPQRREALRNALREHISSDVFQQALACASTGLVEDIRVWKEAPDTERGLKIERALVRYFTRACTRPTPFGLFAGTSAVTFGERTELRLRPRSDYRSCTQPSWELLRKHAELTAEGLGLQRRVRANPTLHVAADSLRCIQPRGEDFNISEFGLDDFVTHVWKAARTPVTLAQLGAALRQLDDELEDEDIEAFLLELVRGRVLLDDVTPAALGVRPLESLVDALQETAAYPPLHDLDRALRDLDALPIDVQGEARADATVKASTIFEIDADARSFATVLHKPCTAATLSRDLLRHVEGGLDLLRRLASTDKTPRMRAFATAFEERFGDREVPLIIATDAVLGAIPEPGPPGVSLLAGLELPNAPQDETVQYPRAVAAWLTRIYSDAITSGRQEIELELEDVEALGRPLAPLPASFTAGIHVMHRADAEDDVFLHFLTGPSGTRIAGRFGHAVPELAEAMREHVRREAEAQPDIVLAELNFSPPTRLGNVTAHPRYYDYEILCFDRAGAPESFQIPINDLYLSRHNGRLILRSKRLGKRVAPRCSNAYHYHTTAFTPAWLLSELAYEEAAISFLWSWLHLRAAPFLPRVRFGRTVLSLRRWNLSARDLAAFVALEPNALRDRGHALVQELRAKWQWPRIIDIVEEDDRSPVDLDNPLLVDALIHLARSKPTLQLEESLHEVAAPVVVGPEGTFNHEIFLSGRCATLPPEKERPAGWSTPWVVPGGECLYLKLYGRPAIQDRTLHAVRELVARAESTCDRWYFIRYHDPHAHLRLRFFGDSKYLHAQLLPDLHEVLAPLADSESMWRLQLDSYQQELTRYGGVSGLELAERLFCIDSQMYLELLDADVPDPSGEVGDDLRLIAGLRAVHDTLLATGWDERERIAFCERARDGFLAEFRLTSPKPLAERYRTRRADIERWLGDDDLPEAVRAILDRRAAATSNVLTQIRKGVAEKRIDVSLSDLVWSYNHMTINRVMPEHPRICEMLVYDFLVRHLRSARARHEKISSSAA